MKKLPYFYLMELGKLVSANQDSPRTALLEKPEIKENISKYNTFPAIQDYNLTAEEVLLIAICWQTYTEENYRCFEALNILEKLFSEEYQQIYHLQKLNRLITKNILKIEDDLLTDEEYKYSIKILLLKESLQFTPSFLKIILEETSSALSHQKICYSSNQEFLDDWLKYVSQLYEIRQRKPTECNSNLNSFRKLMQKRAANSKIKPPLLELKKEYKLNEKELIILIYLMKIEVENSFCDTDEIIKLISADITEYYFHKNSFLTNSNLVKNDLIQVSDEPNILTDTPIVSISPDIANQLTCENATKHDVLQQKINGSNIFSLRKPQHTFADLILPTELKNTLYCSLQQHEQRVATVLQNWGIFAKNNTLKSKNSLIMLFHGAPGTGKTFAAEAVAQALQKKVLVTDISKLQSTWVGESEKNVQKMFKEYQKICSRSQNPPILLLDEADQFLMQRTTNIKDAVDKMMNSLQNLFLEGFEQLQGIMIATSNLTQNIDPAFSRRFQLKLKFPQPAAQQRQQLWNLHLPASIPGSYSIKTDELAKKYQLSGGQIKIIVKNACVEAANRQGNRQKLTQTDLVKYCELEINNNFNSKPKVVGFGNK